MTPKQIEKFEVVEKNLANAVKKIKTAKDQADPKLQIDLVRAAKTHLAYAHQRISDVQVMLMRARAKLRAM